MGLFFNCSSEGTYTCENFAGCRVLKVHLWKFCDTNCNFSQEVWEPLWQPTWCCCNNFQKGSFFSILWISAIFFLREKVVGNTVLWWRWLIYISMWPNKRFQTIQRWDPPVPWSLVMPTKNLNLKLTRENWWLWHWRGRKGLNLGKNADSAHHWRFLRHQMVQKKAPHVQLREGRVESVVQCSAFEKPPWPFLFRSVTPSNHHNTTVQDSEVKNLVELRFSGRTWPGEFLWHLLQFKAQKVTQTPLKAYYHQ